MTNSIMGPLSLQNKVWPTINNSNHIPIPLAKSKSRNSSLIEASKQCPIIGLKICLQITNFGSQIDERGNQKTSTINNQRDSKLVKSCHRPRVFYYKSQNKIVWFIAKVHKQQSIKVTSNTKATSNW